VYEDIDGIEGPWTRAMEEPVTDLHDVWKAALSRADGDQDRARVLFEAYLAGTNRVLPRRAE